MKHFWANENQDRLDMLSDYMLYFLGFERSLLKSITLLDLHRRCSPFESLM